MNEQLKQGAGRRHRRTRKKGFTLLELSLAMTVLMVALMAMSGTTFRMNSLRRQNRERAVAQNSIRAMSERIHALAGQLRRESENWSTDFVDAFAPGGEIGNTFDIQELNRQEGQASIGMIRLFLDEGETDDDIGLELGMPRDLDGDGAADNGDVTATARIIPVVVRASWRGVSGDVELQHPFYVIGY